MQFEHLHTLNEPIGTVEGFDLSAYDRAVSRTILVNAAVASFISSLHQIRPSPSPPSQPDVFPLWEYPCYHLSSVKTLMEFDFSSPVSEETTLTAEGRIEVLREDEKERQPCHGVVMWMEYQLVPGREREQLLSEGLMEVICEYT